MKGINRRTRDIRPRRRMPGHHGNTTIRRWVLGCCLVVAANISFAQNRLEDIEVRSLPDDQIEVRLRLSGPAPEPLSFTIDNPARIALDLPNTTLGLTERRMEVDTAWLDAIVSAEAQGRTRVVLNLDDLVPYQTRVQGDSIYLILGEGDRDGPAASVFTAGAEPSPTPAPAAAPSDGGVIEKIDFRRSVEGAGRIIITLSDPRTVVDLRDEAGRTIVDFKDTVLPENLMRRLDVIDFATPVSTIDALRVGEDARLVIAATGVFDQIAYQSDNVFTVEFQEVQQVQRQVGPLDEAKEYTGDRLTLNFQDIETRAVLQLLADVSGLNIVVSDTVTGNVTLRLQNVPWDQALDIVLQTKGLDMRKRDNVLLIAPAEEIAAREKQQLEAIMEIQQLAPLRTEFIQVNYAKAADLASLISADGGGGTLLSERGSVSIDERTNTLLVQDTSDKLGEIRRLVSRLDIPVRQVLIESRIVIVTDDFQRELGIRWGATYVTDNGTDGLMSITGNANGNDTVVQSGLNNIQNTGQPFPVTLPQLGDRLMVNAPVADPVGSFGWAILGSDYLVDLELSAAQAEGRGEIISSPRVITANQKEAIIEQGTEIPFQEAASSGATTTQFKKAVLSLRVTPQITPDNRIIMDLQVNQDSVGENVASATGGFVPSIDTRSVTTQALVDDGETVVLGGIFETENREDTNKVPVLGDIPGLGYLFRSKILVSDKVELLIFVTPRILEEGAQLY